MQFLSATPFTAAVDSVAAPGYYIQRIQIPNSALTLDWAVLIGDALHNERSALDYLAFELVVLNGGSPTRNTAFPIFKTANSSNLNRLTLGMAQKHVAPVEAEQPYQGKFGSAADDPLLMLSELSNWDKHRALHFCYISASPAAVSVEPAGALELIASSSGPVDNGSEVRRFRSLVAVDTPVHIESNVILEIAFAPGGPCAGRPVVQTLELLASGALRSYRASSHSSLDRPPDRVGF